MTQTRIQAASEGLDWPTGLKARTGLSWPDTIAIGALVVVTLVALVGPFLSPHDPLQPIGLPLQPPGSEAWLGTDDAGRDLLSRTLYGVRTSWFAAIVVITCGVLIGGAIGLIAGAVGGLVDDILMRITDLFLALPAAILAIAVVAALGPSLQNTLIAVGIVWWPYYARIIRGEVKALAARPYMEAARMSGVGHARLLIRHLLPGAMPTIIVAASLDVGALIVLLAGLSFIGLGAAQPAPELGAMAANGLPHLLGSSWVPLVPAVAVFVLAFTANKAGDAFRAQIKDR